MNSKKFYRIVVFCKFKNIKCTNDCHNYRIHRNGDKRDSRHFVLTNGKKFQYNRDLILSNKEYFSLFVKTAEHG